MPDISPASRSDNPRHSIVFNTLLAFVLIISASLFSMLTGLYLADALEGDAEAINQAGSLRMQSYRLVVLAQEHDSTQLVEHISLLERTLESSALHMAINRHSRHALDEQHERVRRHWQTQMRPLLEQQPAALLQYRSEVPRFVAELDDFVLALQQASERKLEIIRALQVGTLFVIVLIAFVLIYGLHNNLATPLRTLTALARRVGRGDFTGQVDIGGDTELSLLARTLNQMNHELAELYADMEHKVDIKTAALQQSNASLNLLFNCARMLYSQPAEPERLMGQLLGEVQQALQCGPLSLCLNQPEEPASHSVFSSDRAQPPDYCSMPDCANCPGQTGAALPSGNHLRSFYLRSGTVEYGTLRLEQAAGRQLQDWQQQLLTTLADLFAASLGLAHLGQQQARLALIEERTVIARELHDSLAQSLSAQKLQLARLKRQISKGFNAEQQQATLSQIEQGLDAAYRQLRELLTTFRIRVDQPGLKPALEATCREFAQNADLQIQLDYRLDACPLTPNEEIHCLQIVREALSNVLKHAHARHCQLDLLQQGDGQILISIEDDGIGIGDSISPAGHYGLTILRERASSLHGNLHIERRSLGGTRVALSFLPTYRSTTLEPVRA
jgi:two-component system nitrate/nitrite sensor histidine kinase NarX